MPDDRTVREALEWLMGVGGLVVLREKEVHVYRGPLRTTRPMGTDSLAAFVDAVAEARTLSEACEKTSGPAPGAP